MDILSALPSFIVVSVLVSAIPFLAVAVSSFTLITVVLMIVRNALGIQQTPANLIIYSVALILSAYVMGPVIHDISTIIIEQLPKADSIAAYERMYVAAIEPVRGFLKRFVDENSRMFFVEAQARIWPNAKVKPGPDDISILVPAFLASELTKAFQIGFLLYLPFVFIDLVVGVIIIALGMQMLSPTVVSTPLKLLLFVAVEGWTRLFQGLILTYVT
ncbi:MAG: type III secretion system export apparatus subunit SctR [Beijerinckiaceae bacterium]